jgi:hypothetical protein
MAKRIIASILGILALLAGALALMYAIEGFTDFSNPDVSFWWNVTGELIMCAAVLTAWAMGIRFLLFAWFGRSNQGRSWIKPVLLGIAFFFPGFVFSLPVTIPFAFHIWPADGRSDLVAQEASLCIGIAVAIICCAVLFNRRNAQRS